MNPSNKQARLALVTGGARRIGAAIVRELHQAGFNVLIHCHYSVVEAKALANSLNQARPQSADVVQGDLALPTISSKLIDAALAFGKRLDLLVNNASVFTKTNLSTFDETRWDELFTTNVKAPFSLSLAARPHLAKQQGSIINICDVHGERPLKDYAEYCQTKAALIAQTKILACEFAPDIRVNAISPGNIEWPEHENTLTKEQQTKILNKIPLKRQGEPNYIAQALLALVENPYITGQVLRVDGGRLIL